MSLLKHAEEYFILLALELKIAKEKYIIYNYRVRLIAKGIHGTLNF
jgi:hypothetical protein